MRPKRASVLSSLATAGLTVAFVTPARAMNVPAYGTITIANDGLGMTATWTYDSVHWSCLTEITGQFHAPTAVTVTCNALGEETSIFSCPLMILTTHTNGLAARAGGRATCTTTLDTGIVTGVNSAQRRGNLGHAQKLVCTAYGGNLPLVPPYRVTCSEPGLPALAP